MRGTTGVLGLVAESVDLVDTFATLSTSVRRKTRNGMCNIWNHTLCTYSRKDVMSANPKNFQQFIDELNGEEQLEEFSEATAEHHVVSPPPYKPASVPVAPAPQPPKPDSSFGKLAKVFEAAAGKRASAPTEDTTEIEVTVTEYFLSKKTLKKSLSTGWLYFRVLVLEWASKLRRSPYGMLATGLAFGFLFGLYFETKPDHKSVRLAHEGYRESLPQISYQPALEKPAPKIERPKKQKAVAKKAASKKGGKKLAAKNKKSKKKALVAKNKRKR